MTGPHGNLVQPRMEDIYEINSTRPSADTDSVPAPDMAHFLRNTGFEPDCRFVYPLEGVVYVVSVNLNSRIV